MGEPGLIDPTRSSTRFRGWWILAYSTLVITLTVPGQTIGVSSFVNEFGTDLRLSDTSISTAYLVGTLIGSTPMAAIGRWIDRRGVRRTTLTIATAFSVVVMAMSTVQNLAMLVVGFTGIRMLGQGSLSLAGQTTIALWFDRYRGLAFGIAMMTSAGLMACGPFALTALIDAFGWRVAWVIAGAVVFAALVPLGALLLADGPQVLGQHPDGRPTEPGDPIPHATGHTPRQAMATGAFWSLTGAMVVASALITGLTFHHFALMEARGLSEVEAAAVFIPQMLGTVGTGFIVAALTDRVSARPLIALSMVAMAAAMIAYRWVEPGAGSAIYSALLGVSGGATRALGSALYPKWFGTRHVGAIRGIATQFGVAASAVGPVIIAGGTAIAADEEQLLLGLLFVPAAAAVAALVVRPPAVDAEPSAGAIANP